MKRERPFCKVCFGLVFAAGHALRRLDYVLFHDQRATFWTRTSRADGAVPEHCIAAGYPGLHVLL